jgi:hypothetical protein
MHVSYPDELTVDPSRMHLGGELTRNGLEFAVHTRGLTRGCLAGLMRI